MTLSPPSSPQSHLHVAWVAPCEVSISVSLSGLALTEAASSHASPMADGVLAEDNTVKAYTPNLQTLSCRMEKDLQS